MTETETIIRETLREFESESGDGAWGEERGLDIRDYDAFVKTLLSRFSNKIPVYDPKEVADRLIPPEHKKDPEFKMFEDSGESTTRENRTFTDPRGI